MKKKLLVGGLAYWAVSVVFSTVSFRRYRRQLHLRQHDASPILVGAVLTVVAPVAMPMRAFDVAKDTVLGLAEELMAGVGQPEYVPYRR